MTGHNGSTATAGGAHTLPRARRRPQTAPAPTRATGTATVRVLIVDDYSVARSGIRLLLLTEGDIEPVAETGTGREAVSRARGLMPDVILIDLAVPDQAGLDILSTLTHDHPEAGVLFFSVHDDVSFVRQAFAAGASGYALKKTADTELAKAVRTVAQGGRYLDPELGARLVAADAEAKQCAEQDPLSSREREVLRLLALGHTNQEIARLLHISVRTIETHRAHIMRKLRLQSRAELVRHALAHGLLEVRQETA